MKQVKALLSSFKPDIVICHSLANTLWFHLCNEGEIEPVKRLLLVAPPSLDLEIDTIKTFFPVCVPDSLYTEEALLVTSDNDPYLSCDEAVSLQQQLGIEMKVIANGGHLNADSNYGEWPWIKSWVLSDKEKAL